MKLEMIAYQPVLLPPPAVKLNKDVLVDFCPINQCFEKQIYDTGASNNATYVAALGKWRQSFEGEIGLYSYFRKYAWHSLPNVCPHYMQRDVIWYANVSLSAISTYAEPGDWFTYELNHYTFGRLAWNPKVKVDSIVKSYCRFRYGEAASSAVKVFAMLEEIVPEFCSIPFTRLKASGTNCYGPHQSR